LGVEKWHCSRCAELSIVKRNGGQWMREWNCSASVVQLVDGGRQESGCTIEGRCVAVVCCGFSSGAHAWPCYMLPSVAAVLARACFFFLTFGT
jgi:hypothetical protein